MFSLLVLCLLGVQACQAGRVHVQGNGFFDRLNLYEENNLPVEFEQGIANPTAPLPVILQRCLADAACTSALNAVAAARQQQQQQHRSHDDATLVAAATETQPQQYRQEYVGDMNAHKGISDFKYITEVLDKFHAEGRRDDSVTDVISLNPGNSAMHEYYSGSLVSDTSEDNDDRTNLLVKGLAALVLFLEAVAGMYLPLLLQRLQSPQWWLSLLNCFSGGIFLSAGIIHMLPHCAEAQEALGPIRPNGGDYPLYLVLVVMGYCAVFYVERVLFDVHGEGHAHCQHSNVYSHSSYYKSLSHRSQRQTQMPPATAAAVLAAGPELLLLPAPAVASADQAGRGVGHGADAGLPAAMAGPAGCKSKSGLGCSYLSKLNCDDTLSASVEQDEPPTPQVENHDHQRHGHGHTHAGKSQKYGHGYSGRLALPSATDGLPLGRGVGVAMQTGVAVGPVSVGELNDDVQDEDAESCHSEHPPRAVCVCVEEQKADAETRGYHNHQQQQQQLPHKSRGDRHQQTDLPGQGSVSHGHGRGGSGEGCQPSATGKVVGFVDAGGDGDDLLHTPVLTGLAPPVPATPPVLLMDGVGSSPIDKCDSRGLAFHHLGEQEQRQQNLLLALPMHPPEACAYHTHHHPHPHHRYRRRSAGPGPLCSSFASGGGAPESRDSSCTSPAQGLDLHSTMHAHHTHHPAHSHGHMNSHHHIIKPRFRFMHGVVLLVALALHTALECIALGLIDARSQFLVLFAAIASHKAVSALALSSRFMREGATLGQVTAYVGPFCLVAPVSILAGVYVGRVAPIARLVFSCFATGTFLYVGASEVIMEEFEGEMRADRRDISTRAARYIKFFVVLVAVGLVAASGLLPDLDHH